MSSLTPISYQTSVSGFLHKTLSEATQSEEKSNLKITSRVLGNGLLLVANVIETISRYFLAFGALAISFALNGEEKASFKKNYVNPFFENAKANASFFSLIKTDLVEDYNTHINPFLQNKVEVPN